MTITVITGCSTGIGYAAALRLAREKGLTWREEDTTFYLADLTLLANDGIGMSAFRDKVFIFNGTYELPFGRGKRFASGAGRALDLIIGGWNLTNTTNIHSGLPFTGYASNCASWARVRPCEHSCPVPPVSPVARLRSCD